MARHEGAGHNGNGGKATEPSKRERESLRRAMLNEGHSVEQIMVEMMQRWGIRRRKAWRYAHGWTLEEVAARYNQHVNDSEAKMAYNRISDYEAWPDRANRPSLTVLTNLAAIYGTVSSNLVDFYDLQHLPKPDRAALQHQTENPSTDKSTGFTQLVQPTVPIALSTTRDVSLAADWMDNSRGHSSNHDGPWSLADVMMTVAYQSREHAEDAQGYIMPETTLDEVTADVYRLARERGNADPRINFSNTVQVRDHIYRLLERRQYPNQANQLYFLASVVCCMLANSSDGYGFSRAAVEQARAAWMYAEIIGHNSLRLYSRKMQAAIANRDNRPKHALELALSAVPWATEPIARASLHGSIAKYSARTAQLEESRASLQTASDAYDSATGDSELFDHLGGIFDYPRAKMLYESNGSYLWLGDITQAQSAITEAEQLYTAMPVEERGFDREAATKIGLAHTRLLTDDMDGAEEALRPVFELPPTQRLKWVVSRMQEFHAALNDYRGATSSLGRQLGEAAEEFTETTAATSIPNPYG